MRFKFDTLKANNLNIDINDNEGYIEFIPLKNSTKANDLLREAAAILGFNCMETDTLTFEAYRISVFAALRKSAEL